MNIMLTKCAYIIIKYRKLANSPHMQQEKKIDKLGYNNSLHYKMYINKNLYLCYQGRIFCENDVIHITLCAYIPKCWLWLSPCLNVIGFQLNFILFFFSLICIFFFSVINLYYSCNKMKGSYYENSHLKIF